MKESISKGAIEWKDIGYSCVYDVYEHFLEVFVTVDDEDLILTGYIKWDGCSNLKIEDKWLHFCGRDAAAKFGVLIERMYDLAKKHIPNFEE